MFDKAEVKNDMTKLEQKFCYRFAIILIETMVNYEKSRKLYI